MMRPTLRISMLLLASCVFLALPSCAQQAPARPEVLAESPQAQSVPSFPSTDALANIGPASGTAVSQRIQALRQDIIGLRGSILNNTTSFQQLRTNGAAGAVQYHSTVAAIQARLQNGTTRGNPILLRQWEEAESALNEVNRSLLSLNALSNAVAADSSTTSYLLEAVQAAFNLSGAVDEDHDQLNVLRDEVSRQVVQVDYLRTHIVDDIDRQTSYLTTERQKLQTLAYAIDRGELITGGVGQRPAAVPVSGAVRVTDAAVSSPVAEAVASSPTVTKAPTEIVQSTALVPAATSPEGAGRLTVIIRFDQPFVDYEPQLSQTMTQVLEKTPNAIITVLAAVPGKVETSVLARYTETAQRNAEAVKRSIQQLGVPTSRLLSSSVQLESIASPEVRVYVKP